MAGENNNERRKIFRSARGTAVPGSYKENDKFSEVSVKEGNFENKLKAYGEKARKDLKEAVAANKPFYVRGIIGGSKKNDNVHLMVNSVNTPRSVQGEVLWINKSGEGKAPYAGGFLKKVVDKDGKKYTFSIPFEAWGAEAESFKDVNKGDVISGGVRERSLPVTKKGGEKKREEGYEFVTAVAVGPAAALAATAELDTDPYPEQPLNESDIDFDDVAQDIARELEAGETKTASSNDYSDDIPF